MLGTWYRSCIHSNGSRSPQLREEGIKKSDLSRDAFMEHAWEWTYKHGAYLDQLKKLGASCDLDRMHFTMDPTYSERIDVFIDLYNKGKIYRDVRMINWDPSHVQLLVMKRLS